MRGDLRIVSMRSVVVLPGQRWSSWIMRPTRRPRRSREDQLEMLARLSSDERRSRRSGEYVPDPGSELRWR